MKSAPTKPSHPANTSARLSWLVEDEEIAYRALPAWSRQTMGKNAERLVANFTEDRIAGLMRLVEALAEPFFVLYVLHTPRGGEALPGRYQSPEIDRAALNNFLSRFEPYFVRDARFDLWIHSKTSQATLVWDRHDKLFAYGPLEAFEAALRRSGFTAGIVDAAGSVPHVHYYREECDPMAREIITAFDWIVSDLRPEDEQ